MARHSSRQVEIFNFSFLDILACTIGLLIFIMVMVFILQSNSPVVDTGAMIQRKLKEAAITMAGAVNDREIASELEAQLNNLRLPEHSDLTPQLSAARANRDQSQHAYDELAKQVGEIQARIDMSRLQRDHSASAVEKSKEDLAEAQARFLQAENDLKAAISESAASNAVVLSPYQRPGQASEHFQVLHVVCRNEDVVIYTEKMDGRTQEVGRTATDSLGDDGKDFRRLLAAHRKLDHALVLFWVRPDGAATYEAAVEHLPDGTEYGSEPANASWAFGSAHE